MSGNYPDDVNQAIFDAYWNDKLDDDIENESPLDEPIDLDQFSDCFEIGHIAERCE